MYRTDYLGNFSTATDFIGKLCGKTCEAVLFDVVHTENSVAVVNNDANTQTQNNIGDIVQRLLDEKAYEHQDYIINYDPDNSGQLISVLFIKEQGLLAGVLSIEKDITAATRLMAEFEAFLDMHNLTIKNENEEVGEITGKNDIDLLLCNMVKSAIEKTGVNPIRLTLNEKVQLVHKLKEQGALKISGAITEIAKQLMVSEPSIYRYLSRLD